MAFEANISHCSAGYCPAICCRSPTSFIDSPSMNRRICLRCHTERRTCKHSAMFFVYPPCATVNRRWNVVLGSTSLLDSPSITTGRHSPETAIWRTDTRNVFRSLFYHSRLLEPKERLRLTMHRQGACCSCRHFRRRTEWFSMFEREAEAVPYLSKNI